MQQDAARLQSVLYFVTDARSYPLQTPRLLVTPLRPTVFKIVNTKAAKLSIVAVVAGAADAGCNGSSHL